MKQLIKPALFFSLFSLLLSTSFAFDFKHEEIPFQLGYFGSSQGNDQHINIQGLIGDQFTVNNNDQGNALVGLGYYVHGMSSERYDLMYGINGFYLAPVSVDGAIIQENIFTNLAYHYKIQNIPLYLAAKANVKGSSERYGLILDVGIGPNFIQTSRYNDVSLDGGITLPDHAFNGQTDTAFSVTAGIGIRFNNVIGQAPLECGYRFFYLGKGDLGRRTNQLLDTLSTGDSYANAVVCAVTI